MDDLTALTTPQAISPNRFRAEVPDGWQQGRGAFGGLVLATVTRAIEAAAQTPERTLRSLTAELCGPVMPGAVELVVEPLRVGKGASTLAARVVQGGDVQAHAVAVLGRKRSSDADGVELARPLMPGWRDVPVLPTDFMVGFARFFEYRNTGAVPFTGAQEPVASGWIRAREPGPARDAAYV